MTWISYNDDRENFPVTRALFDALRESSRVIRGLPDWMLYLNPLDLADIRRESPGGLREEPWVGISMLWEFDFKEVYDIERGFLRLARLPGDRRELRIETQFLLRCAGCGAVVQNDEEWGGFHFRVRCSKCFTPDDRLQPQSGGQDTPSSEAQQPPI